MNLICHHKVIGFVLEPCKIITEVNFIPNKKNYQVFTTFKFYEE
jgi:hypothetical protein